MSRLSLPLLPLDCRGCGACCMAQSSPPGYAYLPFRPLDLPDDLAAELDAYYARCDETGNWRDERPCIWLDRETRRCRHYEWRPDICAEFEVGGEECMDWRQLYPPGSG